MTQIEMLFAVLVLAVKHGSLWTLLTALAPLAGMTQAQATLERRAKRQSKRRAAAESVKAEQDAESAAKAASDRKRLADRDNELREYLKPFGERDPELVDNMLAAVHGMDEDFRAQRSSMFHVGENLSTFKDTLKKGYEDFAAKLAKRWGVSPAYLNNCISHYNRFEYRFMMNDTVKNLLFESWTPGRFDAEKIDGAIQKMGGIPKSDNPETCYVWVTGFIREYKALARVKKEKTTGRYDEKTRDSKLTRIKNTVSDLLEHGHFQTVKDTILTAYKGLFQQGNPRAKHNILRDTLTFLHGQVEQAEFDQTDKVAKDAARLLRKEIAESKQKPDIQTAVNAAMKKQAVS